MDRCLSYTQYTQPLYRRQYTLRIVHCSPVESFSKVRHPSGHERRQHFGDYRSKKELKERGVGLNKEERGEAGAGMA